MILQRREFDEEIVVKAAKECGKIVTVEEHSVIGGLGAAVALLEKYGLNAEGIYKSVKEFI